MMNPRRYEVKVYFCGSQILRNEKTIVGLDLESGHGIQAAHVEMDRLLIRMAHAARIHPRDIKRCRVEVIDEETRSVAYSFYPPTE